MKQFIIRIYSLDSSIKIDLPRSIDKKRVIKVEANSFIIKSSLCYIERRINHYEQGYEVIDYA